MTNFQKVKSFMETFGQEVKSSASFSSPKINNLRYNITVRINTTQGLTYERVVVLPIRNR